MSGFNNAHSACTRRNLELVEYCRSYSEQFQVFRMYICTAEIPCTRGSVVLILPVPKVFPVIRTAVLSILALRNALNTPGVLRE